VTICTFSSLKALVGNDEYAAGVNQRILPTSGFPAPIVPVAPIEVTVKVPPMPGIALTLVLVGLLAEALIVSATFLNEKVQAYEFVAVAKSGRLLHTFTS
jgi:hypothetical protein